MAVGNYNADVLEDRVAILRMTVKAADIGHPTKSFPLHAEWTRRITEEFYKQGGKHKRAVFDVQMKSQLMLTGFCLY